MALNPHANNYAYPLDVLSFLAEQQTHEACALVIVTDTEGGGIRAPGAIMAVTRSGRAAGYVSNGCVDADVIHQAQQAIITQKPRQIRYGKGSPFIDIRLPCGGSLDLRIIPAPSPDVINKCVDLLKRRRAVMLSTNANGRLNANTALRSKTGWGDDPLKDSFTVHASPTLKLRIIGRGTEPLALARLAHAADMDVKLQTPDEALMVQASDLGLITELIKHNQTIPSDDDEWTACILMFHDHDWEHNILLEALKTNAFYIGALGSQKTHAQRCEKLKDSGISDQDISRIKAPIGLIPSLRDASMLAISTLADVAKTYQDSFR